VGTNSDYGEQKTFSSPYVFSTLVIKSGMQEKNTDKQAKGRKTESSAVTLLKNGSTGGNTTPLIEEQIGYYHPIWRVKNSPGGKTKSYGRLLLSKGRPKGDGTTFLPGFMMGELQTIPPGKGGPGLGFSTNPRRVKGRWGSQKKGGTIISKGGCCRGLRSLV